MVVTDHLQLTDGLFDANTLSHQGPDLPLSNLQDGPAESWRIKSRY